MRENWYKEYIENIDITNIEWLKLKRKELALFLDENYYDKSIDKHVHDDDYAVPLGMYYLSFGGLADFKYLLGVTKNNIGKQTILTCVSYVDRYRMFIDQVDYITYLSTIETNKFFRRKGLAKETINELSKYLNPYQNILISGMSPEGRKYGMLNKTIDILRENGFQEDIRSDDDDFDIEEYHKLVRTKKI